MPSRWILAAAGIAMTEASSSTPPNPGAGPEAETTHPRPSVSRQSVGFVTFVVLALLVVVAALFAVLDNRITAMNTSGETLIRLSGALSKLDALEWRAVAEGKVSAELQAEIAEGRTAIEDLLRSLESHGRFALDVKQVRADYRRYAKVVDTELSLLADERFEEAEAFDEDEVDPAFDGLSESLDHLTETLGASLGSMRALARATQTAAVGLGFGMVLLHVWQVQSAKRRALRETLAREFLIEHGSRLEAEVASRTAELAATISDLRLAKRNAENAARAKDEFLANISHELRTPLHGILSFAQFGMRETKGHDNVELNRYFTQITESGDDLLKLLNDLIDLAKLDAGRMTYSFQPVDLGDLVAGVLEEHRLIGLERGVQMSCVLHEEEPTVVADRLRMTQVIRNVIANASRFARGRVEVHVLSGPEENTFLVRVEDDGPGIPEGELETIFDKFVQSSRTRSGAGGSGLGLCICRQIVAAHGGTIWADNRSVEGGAVLSITLPVDPTAAPQAPPLAATEPVSA